MLYATASLLLRPCLRVVTAATAPELVCAFVLSCFRAFFVFSKFLWVSMGITRVFFHGRFSNFASHGVFMPAVFICPIGPEELV